MPAEGKITKQGKDKSGVIDGSRDGRLLEKIDDDVLLINKIKADMKRGALKDIKGNDFNEDDKRAHDESTECYPVESENGPIKEENEDLSVVNATNNKSSDSNGENCSIHGDKVCSFENNIENSTSNTNNDKNDNNDHNDADEDDEVEGWDDPSKYYKNTDPKSFRQYELACDRVKQFYQEQHEKQTVAYNIQARINFKTKTRARMTVWEGLEKLNKLLDDSDPDTELSQIDHALQTAEAIRRDKKPRWFQLVGLIHDLGKLLYFFDSKGQWDVVGDTFPVGCKYLRKIIFPESFKKNSDMQNPLYNTKYGIYLKNCGLDKVMISWGHDEYMFHIAKENSTLPQEALAMIRYHSFYPWHHENAYKYLMDDHDKEMLKAVQTFNRYDLYSKIDEKYDVNELKQYYLDLIDEYFPVKVIDF